MRLAAGLVALWVAFASGSARISREDLFRLLSESAASDLGDEKTAEELAGLTLDQPLGQPPIRVIQELGFGPRTLQAIRVLSPAITASDGEPFASTDPRPDSKIQSEMMRRVSDYAELYVHGLPNFLCTETTRYYQSGKLQPDRHKSTSDRAPAQWRLDQTITEQVRYHDGAEEYTTQLVNGRVNQTPIEELRTSYSRGEFGGVLAFTFSPISKAIFNWDHWETIGGKRVAVFRYSIEREHSQYAVCCVAGVTITRGGVSHQRRQTWRSAYQGRIYADPGTGTIARFTYQNVNIPTAISNLDDGRNLVEYAPTTIGARTSWLPRKVIHYTRQGAYRMKSETQFTNYREFGATSTLQFPTE